MSLNLDHPPFHRSHRRAVSIRILDTALENPVTPTITSRPSTASTQSSFSTAYTSLASEPRFHYYLPHISTNDEGVYTRNDNYACNLSATALFQPLPPVHFGRFYQYVPDLSGEEDDVYTDGVNFMHDMLRGPGQLHVQPEQKVIGKFREVQYGDSSNELASPLSYIGPKDFAYWPKICVTDAVDVDVRSSAAGQRFGSSVDVSTGSTQVEEGKGNKLHKANRKQSVSLVEMSEKVKGTLRKLHISKKTKK
jgi:hypothetical protein